MATESCEGVLIAVYLSTVFIVVVAQHFVAIDTGEASRVEFRPLLSLEVRALDSVVTLGAQRIVELVVVVLAIWVVVDDIEVGGSKW